MNLFTEIRNGNNVALSKGITLIESELSTEKEEAQALLSKCKPYSGESIRIGITGSPGVGKSTFIESFGEILTHKGNKVAVLAIDPTSERTKGSILGDKSRMEKLAVNKKAFIRPSPSQGNLGGIARKTKESIILCEAAGYNIILIETVGVGQSETTISNIVDFCLLLILAGAGDELQGIKRGIMEIADGIAVTKADGDNIENAKQAALSYQNSLHLFSRDKDSWNPKTSICSAIENTGIEEIWEIINAYNTEYTNNQIKERKRKEQEIYWMHTILKEEIGNKRYTELIENDELSKIEEDIINNQESIQEYINKLLQN